MLTSDYCWSGLVGWLVRRVSGCSSLNLATYHISLLIACQSTSLPRGSVQGVRLLVHGPVNVVVERHEQAEVGVDARVMKRVVRGRVQQVLERGEGVEQPITRQ